MAATLPPEVGCQIGQTAPCNRHVASGDAREGKVLQFPLESGDGVEVKTVA